MSVFNFLTRAKHKSRNNNSISKTSGCPFEEKQEINYFILNHFELALKIVCDVLREEVVSFEQEERPVYMKLRPRALSYDWETIEIDRENSFEMLLKQKHEIDAIDSTHWKRELHINSYVLEGNLMDEIPIYLFIEAFNYFGLNISSMSAKLTQYEAKRFQGFLEEAKEHLANKLWEYGSACANYKKLQNSLSDNIGVLIAEFSLKNEDGRFNVPPLFITKKGIYAFHLIQDLPPAKGEYIVKITKEGSWRKVYRNGEIEENVDMQNKINDIFKTNNQLSKMINAPIESVLVFANESIPIINDSSLLTVGMNQLITVMEKSPCKYNDETLDVWLKTIGKLEKESQKIEYINFSDVLHQNFNEIEYYVESLAKTIPVFYKYNRDLKNALLAESRKQRGL